MNLFDLVDENLFSPLAGGNRRLYWDILTTLWAECKRETAYCIERRVAIDTVEELLVFMNAMPDIEDLNSTGEILSGREPRLLAGAFMRRLKGCGWLQDRDAEYGGEPLVAMNHRVVPLLMAGIEITEPRSVTYKGKLYKIYKLLETIESVEGPYENVIREVAQDITDLNASLRQLTASIGTHIDGLTQGKTPEEVLTLFEQYEERIVVGAYHRFKTNENLFYYRSFLLQKLDYCHAEGFDSIVHDYSEVEGCDRDAAAAQVRRLLFKIHDDIEELTVIMRMIDDRHILYRSRAVQRAQFLLLSDGTIKNKINQLLHYMALTSNEELDIPDECLVQEALALFSQGYVADRVTKKPRTSKKRTPIEPIAEIPVMDAEEERRRYESLMAYIRNAVTAQNVNQFIVRAVEGREAVTAAELMAGHPDDITKIIGLHTYSMANERCYDITENTDVIVCNGLIFRDFTITLNVRGYNYAAGSQQ